MNLKPIKCWMIELKRFIKHGGVFVPHCYVEKERYKHDIFYTDKSFRVTNTYQHNKNEKFVKNAILIGYECKRCGKKELLWQRSDNLPIIK